jgi:HK97 family phage major capsid protein
MGELEKMKEALQAELKAFKEDMPTYATPEDLDNKFKSLEDQVKELNVTTDLTELKAAMEEQGVKLAKLNEGFNPKQESLEEIIQAKAEEIANVAKAQHGKVSFNIKTDVTRSSVTNHTLAYRLPDVGQLAFQATKLEPFFASGTVGANSNGIIRYVDQSSITRNAAETAEAGVKPESAIAWQEYTLPIEKVADTIPVTMEAMADVNFVASEIRNMLANNLRLRIDNQLYDGDGVTPNIFGIYTKADTYTPASSGIGGANLFDLILKVQEDIVDGTQYEPNVAFVTYADYNSMLLNKEATTNAYIAPNWSAPVVEGGQPIMNVNGINVVPSASVTTNTLVLGDFNYATIYNLGGVTIDMGWIDKQFVENMMTIRAERRLGMLVRTAHTDAFRKVTDVSTALTTLAT